MVFSNNELACSFTTCRSLNTDLNTIVEIVEYYINRNILIRDKQEIIEVFKTNTTIRDKLAELEEKVSAIVNNEC